MPATDPLYVFVAVASGLAGLALAWPGLRNREKPGATGFLVVVGSGSLYALATAAGAVLVEPRALFVLQNLTVLAGSGLGVGWLLLTAEYTDRLAPTRQVIGIVTAYLLVEQAVVWTNPFHRAFYVPLAESAPTFAGNVDALFWVHAGVAYALIVVGTGLLVVDLVRSHGIRRRQTLALGLVPVPGLAANLVSNLGVVPVDLTPVAFPLALAFLAWALFHADFLDVVPVGRATVLESMTDPVVTVGGDDRVVDSNAAAREIVGTDEGWQGTAVAEFFEPVPELAAAIERGKAPDGELTVAVDGTERVFDLTVSPLSADGKALDRSRGQVVVLREVTEAARQRRRVESQNERLERLADVIAHDMRGPVSTGQKTLTLLRRELDDPDEVVEQGLDNLDAVNDRLYDFVEHLPTLARESTNVETTTNCDLASVARAAWGVVDTGEVELEVVESRTLRADPSRLQQALENLFRNATDHGSVRPGNRPNGGRSDASAAAEQASAGESIAVTTVRVGRFGGGFYVEDDGPGIPPSLGQDVFEYGTGDGSGFGLAIVRTIVEAHGWSIDVTDGSDGGARFAIHTDG